MSFMNRLATAANPYQGKFKRVLCVCSAGLLRSPTTAVVLSQEPFNHNTRAAGLTQEFALVPVDQVLLTWADEVVCMEAEQKEILVDALAQLKMERKPVVCLDLPDNFSYRDPELMKMIADRYSARAPK